MKISLLTICTFVLVGSHISVAEYSSASAPLTHTRFEQDGQASSKSSTIANLGSSSRIPRQSRCIRCSYPDDKYGYGYRDHSDYDYYGRTYGGNNRYGYGGYGGGDAISRTGYDDRNNWYYYSDRYDDRMNRYPDRYGSSPLNVIDPSAPRKYEDRYASRTYDRYDMPYGYDRYDYRNSYNDYRGNGYDNNRDYYGSNSAPYYKDRTYDRFRGGYEGRYNDRDIYDRNYYRAPYDFRNYRPFDETYRGQSGFDNSGRGYYFASRPDDSPQSYYRPAPPPSPYHDDERNSYPPRPRPYSPLPPPRPLHDSLNNAGSSSGAPGDSSAPPSSHSSGSASGTPSSSSASGSGSSGPSSSSSSRPYQYDDRQSRPGADSNRDGYAGRWTYLDDRDKGSGYHDNDRNQDRNRDHNRDSDVGGGRDKDSQSGYAIRGICFIIGRSGLYNPRPRPLGGAYLLDRDNNKPVAINGENKDSKIDDQTKMSAIASSAENNNGMPASGSSSSGDNTKN